MSSDDDMEARVTTTTDGPRDGGTGCRFCGAALRHTFADLGMSPLCETFLTPDELNAMEPFYPLHVRVCDECFLVQLQEYVSPADIFSEYAYFSSYSDAWLAHAREYVDAMIALRGLASDSLVVELASNDGYLLQYFVQAGIPVLGIEPAANVAAAGVEKGVPALVEFFDEDLARRMVAEGRRADLIVGNNVLAQVPDLNTFVAGMSVLLAPGGHITIEFPHLLRLMEEPVRHDLPRALLVLLAARRRTHLLRPWADHPRRGGAVEPRRLAAHPRRPHGRRRARALRAHAGGARRRGAGGPPPHRDLRGLRRAGA